jgi:hypothetical protein
MFLYTAMTGIPFEFDTADAKFIRLGRGPAGKIFSGRQFRCGIVDICQKLSSQGIVTMIGVVYALSFDSIIVFRIVNSLLGAWLCLMIFDIAGRSFGKRRHGFQQYWQWWPPRSSIIAACI